MTKSTPKKSASKKAPAKTPNKPVFKIIRTRGRPFKNKVAKREQIREALLKSEGKHINDILLQFPGVERFHVKVIRQKMVKDGELPTYKPERVTWTELELDLFEDLLKEYGRSWDKLANGMGTKSAKACRTQASKR